MTEKQIIRIGNVELYADEALKLYTEKQYIVTYSRIYQLHYSAAQKRVYGTEIYYQPKLCLRGRYHTMSAAAVNRLIGKELLNAE